MVDLQQNSLNFLAEIVTQIKAVCDSIGNQFNSLGDSRPSETEKNGDFGIPSALPTSLQTATPQFLHDSQPSFRVVQEPSIDSVGGSAPFVAPSISAIVPLPDRDGSAMGSPTDALGTQPRLKASDIPEGQPAKSLHPDRPSEIPPDRSSFPMPSIPTISRNLLKRYDREDIYDRVWRKPVWQVANDLGITEHALCNACIKLYIPTPPRGYWNLKESNRNSIERHLLPDIASLIGPEPAKAKTADGPKSVSALLMSRYDREKLFQEVWSMPLNQVGALYGVCDTTIFIRCKNLHIPTPGPEYWQNKELGKPLPERPPLPPVAVTGFTENTRNWEERNARFGKTKNGSPDRASRRCPNSQS